MGGRNRIYVLNHEMKIQTERLQGNRGSVEGKGRWMKKGENPGGHGHFVDTSLHTNSKSKTELLRLHGWMRI